LLDEFSWRDYFQRIYAAIGDDIWLDFEPYKTGFSAKSYARVIPEDLRMGQTGAVCIDSFVRDLETVGYLHNHVRLWLSAYVVHWRRVSWQTGAQWWLEHLLDGGPASNALGWQWVASTWRRFPYIWNRGNLIKNAGMRYCEKCPLFESGCPFAGTYASLSAQLFPKKPDSNSKDNFVNSRLELVPDSSLPKPRVRSSANVLVWVHGDALRPDSPTFNAYPDAPALYVWDEALLESYRLTLKRLQFLYECLLELPVDIARGDVAQQLITRTRAEKRTVIATVQSVAPKFSEIVQRLESEGFTVQIWPEEPFARHEAGFDLRSHASYYRVARKSVEAGGKALSEPPSKSTKERPKKTATKTRPTKQATSRKKKE
jgi:deoxyribodipyrimidine photo-lyase